MKLGSLLAVILAAPCRAALHLDLALVKDGAKDYVQIRQPFVATYRSGDFRLDYIAGKHEFSTTEPTMALIKTLIARKPDFIIIEGPQASEGVSSKSYLEYARRNCKPPACPEGEPGYAALLAARAGIPFQGGEPDEKDVTAALLAQGYSPQDWLAYDFLRNAGWRKDQPKFSSSQVPALFAQIKARPDHAEAKDFQLSDFEAWYQTAAGKRFSLAALDVSRDESPDPHGSRIQRISAAIDAVRNLTAMKVLETASRAHHHVLIIYGRGHYDAEKAALDKELGAPVLTTGPGH